MRTVEGVVGNRRDDAALDERLQAHDRAGTLERAVIEARERRKSRLRIETDAGTDLGVVVEQPPLREGDVLFVDEDAAAVVTFEPTEAVVVDLPAPTPESLAAAVELGHCVGNHHWDVAVEDGAVYVPLEADRRVVEDALAASVPDGVSIRHREVDASLFLDDADRPDDAGTHDHPRHGGPPDHSHGVETSASRHGGAGGRPENDRSQGDAGNRDTGTGTDG